MAREGGATWLVGVYFNLDLRDKYFGYKPEHRLVWAGDVQVTAPDSGAAIEKVWAWAQRADGMNAQEGVFAFIDGQCVNDATGDRWLDEKKMPSLSVGDVLLVNAVGNATSYWYATAPIGFVEVGRPSHLELRPGRVRLEIDLAMEVGP